MTTEIKCPSCGENVVVGDTRSGILSSGSFFVEYDGDKKTFSGDPKIKPVPSRNRVISLACKNCGLISSYLEDIIHKK